MIHSRWIRLLFGREFPMDDVLVLWDALFADGPMLDLVDYIYISMLEAIRDKRMFVVVMGKISVTSPIVINVQQCPTMKTIGC